MPSVPTVVSLTPLPLEADSRTLKSALSYARWGFRSIVIEGHTSKCATFPEGIEVISPGPSATATTSSPHATAPRQGLRQRIRSIVRKVWGGPMPHVPLLRLAIYMAYFFVQYRVRPRKLVPPATLYHVHSYELFDVAWEMARRCGGKVLYDAHDFYQGITPPERMTPFNRRWLFPMLRTVEARAIARADAIVTATDGTSNLITAEFGRRPTVLRNCHDKRLDTAPERTIREHLGLTDEQRLLVVSGNYKPGMAVPTLLDALSLLPASVHVAFVGRGYDTITDLIARHPAGQRVFTGLVMPPTQLVPFLRSADIGLVIYEPYSENYRYALPNGFFHVTAAGLPVIYPPLPDVVTAVAGRPLGHELDSLTPATLAGAIQTLLDGNVERRPSGDTTFNDLLWAHEEQVLLDEIQNLIPVPRPA